MNSLGVSPYVNWLYSDLADGLIIFQVHIQHIRVHLSLLSIYNDYHTLRHVVNGRKHPITFQTDTCGYEQKSVKSHGMMCTVHRMHIHYGITEYF